MQVDPIRKRSIDRISTGRQILDSLSAKKVTSKFTVKRDQIDGTSPSKPHPHYSSMQTSPRLNFINEESPSGYHQQIQPPTDAFRHRRATSSAYSKASITSKLQEGSSPQAEKDGSPQLIMRLHRRGKSIQEGGPRQDDACSTQSSAPYDFSKSFFERSPIAQHYAKMQQQSTNYTNTTFNKSLKTKDTFTSVFPTYQHGEGSVQRPPHSHLQHAYPAQNCDGSPTHVIDRTHYHKLDFLKQYTEDILKIANMRGNKR